MNWYRLYKQAESYGWWLSPTGQLFPAENHVKKAEEILLPKYPNIKDITYEQIYNLMQKEKYVRIVNLYYDDTLLVEVLFQLTTSQAKAIQNLANDNHKSVSILGKTGSKPYLIQSQEDIVGELLRFK